MVHLGAVCRSPNHHSRHSDWPILPRILSLARRVLQAVRPDDDKIKMAEFPKFGIPPLRGDRGMNFVPTHGSPGVGSFKKSQQALTSGSSAANVLPSGLTWWPQMKWCRMRAFLTGAARKSMITVAEGVQTTDSRDKVYVFLGVAADMEKSSSTRLFSA